jgi:hypothetical protein
MKTIDTIIAVDSLLDWIGGKHAGLRSHKRPRSSMFLGQHKRHEVDFAKSPGAQDTVVSFSTVFLIIRTGKSKKKAVNARSQIKGYIAHTKCLIAVPIPPFWTPFTYAAAIIPERKGSSAKLSKLYILCSGLVTIHFEI